MALLLGDEATVFRTKVNFESHHKKRNSRTLACMFINVNISDIITIKRQIIYLFSKNNNGHEIPKDDLYTVLAFLDEPTCYFYFPIF